jgi:hypothetical protein
MSQASTAATPIMGSTEWRATATRSSVSTTTGGGGTRRLREKTKICNSTAATTGAHISDQDRSVFEMQGQCRASTSQPDALERRQQRPVAVAFQARHLRHRLPAAGAHHGPRRPRRGDRAPRRARPTWLAPTTLCDSQLTCSVQGRFRKAPAGMPGRQRGDRSPPHDRHLYHELPGDNRFEETAGKDTTSQRLAIFHRTSLRASLLAAHQRAVPAPRYRSRHSTRPAANSCWFALRTSVSVPMFVYR